MRQSREAGSGLAAGPAQTSASEPSSARQVVLVVPVHPPTDALLRSTYQTHAWFAASDKEAFLREVVHCEVAVTSGSSGIRAALMERLPALRLVACFGVGVDGVDLDYARAHGIQVTNTPEVLTEEVADFALALLLSTLRQVPQADRHVREGQWLEAAFPLTGSLRDRRVGIVGMGRIGQAIARRCSAFGVPVAYHGPAPKPGLGYAYFDSALALAQACDVLIAACRGGAQTAGLVSREVMKALGPQGCLINVSRGSVVDQNALVELLNDGSLGCAGLDVFDDEPRVPAPLVACPRVVLTPHMASGSHTTRAAMGRLTLDNVAAYMAGRPLLTPV